MLVALVGTVAVAYIAICLAHGANIGSTVARAGSLVSLAITCLLALAAASATELSGAPWSPLSVWAPSAQWCSA